MNNIDLIGKIGDLKEVDYKNTLSIATLLELLIDKDILTRQEFARKSYFLDNMSLEELKKLRTGC